MGEWRTSVEEICRRLDGVRGTWPYVAPEVVAGLTGARLDDLGEVARFLYSVLREVDRAGHDTIVVELTGMEVGLGRALDDRIRGLVWKAGRKPPPPPRRSEWSISPAHPGRCAHAGRGGLRSSLSADAALRAARLRRK